MEAEFRLRLDDPRAWQRLRPLLDSSDPDHVAIGLQTLQAVESWRDVDRESAAAIDRVGERRDLLFMRAVALERLDDVPASSTLFERLVDESPEDASAANYLGYMWADREMNLDRALVLIGRAVAIEPENPAYLDSLGWVHFRLGEFDEAEHWLRRAAALGGGAGGGTILCHLGEVLLALGKEDEARRFLMRGLDLGCEHPDHVRSLITGLDDESD